MLKFMEFRDFSAFAAPDSARTMMAKVLKEISEWQAQTGHTIVGMQWQRVVDRTGPAGAIVEIIYDDHQAVEPTTSPDLHAQGPGVPPVANGGAGETHEAEP